MSTSRGKRSARTGEPTISGKDPDPDSEENEEDVADESNQQTKRSANPLHLLSYDQYKFEMVVLAKAVKDDCFGFIVDVRLPSTEVLQEEYKRVCPILDRPGDLTKRTLDILDRWSVPAPCLRSMPLFSGDEVRVHQGAIHSPLYML
jgi:hypothetical protein